MLRLLDLFSGIGGFSLAARWTGAIETVAFVEIDPFCQKVLRKHWPSVPIISDIREVTGERIREIVADTIDKGLFGGCGGSDRNGERLQEGQQEWNITRGAVTRCDEESPADTEGNGWGTRGTESEGQQGGASTRNGHIDILTGGFPCQPFSCAGKRKGTDDNRYLWPEMLRVIREVRPTWVVAENVSGLLTIGDGVVFEDCCTDLEKEGYEVQPFIIPACAVNAPHRRDRVWIVAHAHSQRERTGLGEVPQEDGKVPEWHHHAESEQPDRHAHDAQLSGHGEYGPPQTEPNSHRAEDGLPESADSHAPDTDAGRIRRYEREGVEETSASCGGSSDAPHPGDEGLQGCSKAGNNGTDRTQPHDQYDRGCLGWHEPWLEVATRLCRVDDGLPRGMDRVNRLKALGNAIVPQVAYEILRGICKVESQPSGIAG